jgi:hypothetical protein
MKVLFLDIDGVLNTRSYCQHARKTNAGSDDRGKFIMDKKVDLLKNNLFNPVPDLYTVVHSSWRSFAGTDDFQRWLIGLRVIGHTDPGDPKDLSILKWLNTADYDVDRWKVVDDSQSIDGYTGLDRVRYNVCNVNQLTGLTETDIQEKLLPFFKDGYNNE